jgi:DNA adenine methylase
MGDPTYHDPRIAGWWIWGISCWIGGGWCDGTGPWVTDAEGRITQREKTTREPGVSRKLPHRSDDGKGVHSQTTREPGVGDYHPMTMPEVRRWFGFLSARLRHVRILNGDWTRGVTSGALKTLSVRSQSRPGRTTNGHCGVFLDPPYSAEAGRDGSLYAVEDLSVAHDVRERIWFSPHCLGAGVGTQVGLFG